MNRNRENAAIALFCFLLSVGSPAYGCLMPYCCASLHQLVRAPHIDRKALLEAVSASNDWDLKKKDCQGNTALHLLVWHKEVTVQDIQIVFKHIDQLYIRNNDGVRVCDYHRMLSLSPSETPEEGLIKAQTVPNGEVMHFLFAMTLTKKLEIVAQERYLQKRQKEWSQVSYFR